MSLDERVEVSFSVEILVAIFRGTSKCALAFLLTLGISPNGSHAGEWGENWGTLVWGASASCSAGPNLSSLSTEEQVQLVYVGLLSRAADSPGLNYWIDDINSGFTIEKLRENIVLFQTEYLEDLGTLLRPDLVPRLYQNLFTRSPDDAGEAYWVSGDGATVAADRLVLALINGAGCTDRKTLTNKAEAASYYTNNYQTYNKTHAINAVKDVDSTDASLAAAKAYVDSI